MTKKDLKSQRNFSDAVSKVAAMLAFYHCFDQSKDSMRSIPFISNELPAAINRVRVLFGPAFKRFMQSFDAPDASEAKDYLEQYSTHIDYACLQLARIPFDRTHLAGPMLEELADKDMVIGWKEIGDTYTDEILSDWNLVFTDGTHVGVGRLTILAGEWRGYIYAADGKAAIIRPTHYMPAKDLLGTLPKP